MAQAGGESVPAPRKPSNALYAVGAALDFNDVDDGGYSMQGVYADNEGNPDVEEGAYAMAASGGYASAVVPSEPAGYSLAATGGYQAPLAPESAYSAGGAAIPEGGYALAGVGGFQERQARPEQAGYQLAASAADTYGDLPGRIESDAPSFKGKVRRSSEV
jgi:hypothetical protein